MLRCKTWGSKTWSWPSLVWNCSQAWVQLLGWHPQCTNVVLKCSYILNTLINMFIQIGLFFHITRLFKKGNEFRLHDTVLPPLSRLGGVRLHRNGCAFSIRWNYGCVRGRFSCVDCPSWRHFPRLWDPLVYFAGRCWGSLTAPTWKQTRARLDCFLFVLSVLSIRPRALLNPPRFDMASPSVMGCPAQGMYLWPLFFLTTRSAWSCRQQLRLRVEI